jgi:hypothetical protein
MHASTLRDAADTLTERVSDLAHTVAEITPEVTGRVGETAYRLAAKTPWVEEPVSHAWRRWILRLTALAAVAVAGWWWMNRRPDRTTSEPLSETATPDQTGRHLRAASGT